MKKLLSLFFILAAVQSASAQLCKCELLQGWEQKGKVREYNPDNLFEYIDGAAEGYLIFDFVKMSGLTCQSKDVAVEIDFYEMGDPECAYGIFTANRNPKSPNEKIGMAGQISTNWATFVKDKYYISLALNSDKDSRAALRAFVTVLEKKINGRSTPPDIVGWFPKQNLVPDSVRLVPQSVLGISMLKRGYVAQYDLGKAFIVQEDSQAAAAQLMAKLKGRLGQTTPGNIGEESFTGNDKYLDGVLVFRKGRILGGFANLKAGMDASTLALRMAANVK